MNVTTFSLRGACACIIVATLMGIGVHLTSATATSTSSLLQTSSRARRFYAHEFPSIPGSARFACVYTYLCGERTMYVGKAKRGMTSSCRTRIGTHSRNFATYMTITTPARIQRLSLTGSDDVGDHDLCILQQCIGKKMTLRFSKIPIDDNTDTGDAQALATERLLISHVRTDGDDGCNRSSGTTKYAKADFREKREGVVVVVTVTMMNPIWQRSADEVGGQLHSTTVYLVATAIATQFGTGHALRPAIDTVDDSLRLNDDLSEDECTAPKRCFLPVEVYKANWVLLTFSIVPEMDGSIVRVTDYYDSFRSGFDVESDTRLDESAAAHYADALAAILQKQDAQGRSFHGTFDDDQSIGDRIKQDDLDESGDHVLFRIYQTLRHYGDLEDERQHHHQAMPEDVRQRMMSILATEVEVDIRQYYADQAQQHGVQEHELEQYRWYVGLGTRADTGAGSGAAGVRFTGVHTKSDKVTRQLTPARRGRKQQQQRAGK
eukprot:TRINITY_DN12012_c0_g1_i1.p1 TRINITY_DN12012_c0_g1~~TRINITY_DN12012_c0_g1_i1.p1  ORF type:complete len:492 (+),score=71.50 TRINITY_DN12012_c0_g1_i1:55-1530(+)